MAVALVVVACTGPAAPTGGTQPAGTQPAGTQPAGTEPAGSPAAGTVVPVPTAGGEAVQVELQLQWEPQAQFAGYFAAEAEGYFAEEGLQVSILRGGAEIIPQVVGSDPNGPEFTISWVPKVLEVRDQGQSDLVDIAQVFQRSGTRSVSWAAGAGPDPTSDEDITSPEQFADKNIGVWDFGNEYEVTAAGKLHELEPDVDYTKVIQPFNMDLLLNREVDVAEAMIYNEYAQVLETEDPKTGELYQPDDFTAVNWNDEGTAMLQDAIWADTEKLENDTAYQDQTVKFLEASFRGWAYCRDNPEECRDMVVARGSKLGDSHQLWQMNEVNKLIWPSPNGIGLVDEAAWNQTVEIASSTKNQDGDTVLTQAPEGLAYTNEYAQQAIDALKADGIDVTGESFEPTEVELKEGGA
jgi:NitT/TauT family transport system substrate-binding protein